MKARTAGRTRRPMLAEALRGISKLAVSPLSVPQGWHAIPLRLIAGYGFLAHGYAKLSRGPEGFISILDAIGLPFPHILGWAAVVVEVVGGVMILCGALVPIAAAPMMVVLLVAIVTVHLPNGFSSIKLQAYDAAGAHFGQPGYETDLLYLACLLALCMAGAGPFSIDANLNRWRKDRLESGRNPNLRSPGVQPSPE